VQLLDRDLEIRLVEFIRNVPSESAKLTSFLNNTVEEAETKEQLTPGMLGTKTKSLVGVLYIEINPVYQFTL
jgi:hypothetical protein